MDTHKPQSFQLRPSAIHIAILLLGVALAVGTLLSLATTPTVLALALAAIALAGWLEFRRARLTNSTSVVGFSIRRNDAEKGTSADPFADNLTERDLLTISILLKSGADQAMTEMTPTMRGWVHRGSVATPWVVSILYWRDDDRWWRRQWPRLIAVWPDSMHDEEFRRLRVLLKWGQTFAVTAIELAG